MYEAMQEKMDLFWKISQAGKGAGGCNGGESIV